MVALLKDIIAYLNHPRLVSIPEKVEKPGLLLFRLSLICLVTGIVSGVAGSLLTGSGLIPGPGPSVTDRITMPEFMLVLGPLLLAPLAEEMIFRWQLRRISLSILFIAFITGTVVSGLTGTTWGYLISPLAFTVLYLIYRFMVTVSLTRKYRFWRSIFPLHFHLTAVCFALVHLANFEKGVNLLPFGILYTLPQLSTGLVLGYTRMNYGLKYAMAVHALYNLLPALLLISR
jgi:hypothetical protein